MSKGASSSSGMDSPLVLRKAGTVSNEEQESATAAPICLADPLLCKQTKVWGG